MSIPGDARTGCFCRSYDPDQLSVELGQELAEAFVALYSNVGQVDDVMEQLWRRADDAIADLLLELWLRSPDDRAEVLAKVVQKAVDGKLKKGELRRALGTTRGGDPLLMCNAHYHSLSRTQQQRLWQSYKAWKRLERQRLRLKAETGEVPRALLFSIATAVSGYIEVRNDCIRSLAPPELELAQ